LLQTAEELKNKLERAEKLVTGLAGEKDRWEVSLEKFDIDINNLPGDCCVAAAFLSYAGPFGSKYSKTISLGDHDIMICS
jgi:dynein heavy chain, axonemal